MAWNDKDSPGELENYFLMDQFKEAKHLLGELHLDLESTNRRIDALAAKKVLATLRRYAWFKEMNKTAEIFARYAQDDRQVLRQLAQSRIEVGQITQAIKCLLDLEQRLRRELRNNTLDPGSRKAMEFELGEAMGLLGRCYKQSFVKAKPSRNKARNDAIDKALAYYGNAYQAQMGDYLWHGINFVALLTRKERIQKNEPNYLPAIAAKHANEILTALENMETTTGLKHWELANRMEAYLAVGKYPEAIETAKKYLECPGVDAFAIQSTRRQMIEVWMLTEKTPPGKQILPMMMARCAQIGGGGGVELRPSQRVDLEAIWGETAYQPLTWLKTAVERSSCVARLGPSKYEGNGTGFLIDGSWINAAHAGKPLLLTNAHVCSNDPAVQAQRPYPKPHTDLKAVFLGANDLTDAKELNIAKLLWTSEPSDLDATLLLLDEVPKNCVAPPLGKSPKELGGDARLNVIGHPKGLTVRVSMQDNKLIAVDNKYLHYRTPTDEGSSGSPVFNQAWDLVALHHGTAREKRANEGIRIELILKRMRAELK